VADNDLPPEVLRLIDTFAPSMDHVELLLKLHESVGAHLSVDDLVALGHIDRAAVIRILRDLEAAHVVLESDGAYRYAPSPGDADAVRSLMDMYNSRPVTLVRAIYARPTPVKSFADAFRLRRSE
jgi:hypothetical protein